MKPVENNYRDSKEYTTFRVFKKILRDGPVSRSDIASSLGMTNASVLNRVNELTSRSFIKVIGYEKKPSIRTAKGRYSHLIDVDCPDCFAIAFILENNILTGVLSTLKELVLEKIKVKVDMVNVDYLSDQIAKVVEELLNHSCLSKKNVMGVALSVSYEHFQDLQIEMFNDMPVCDKITKVTAEKLDLPFYVNTISAASSTYYVNEFLKGKVSPQKVKVTLYDITQDNTVAVAHRFPNSYYLKINQKALKNYALDYKIKNEDDGNLSIELGTFKTELTTEKIIRDTANLPDCKNRDFWYSQMGRTHKEQANFIEQQLKKGNEELKKVIRQKTVSLSITLYNMYVVTQSDKLVIADFYMKELFYPYIKNVFKELFGSQISAKLYLSENPEMEKLHGTIINAIDRGFIDYYFDNFEYELIER
jgi:DNA-binding Lrp family transcriptional regulator